MEFSFPTIMIVPIALGLLGFIEPCTIGGHLVFLRAIAERSPRSRLASVLIFTSLRTSMIGLFGAFVALLGQHLIDLQTALWALFGLIYILIGMGYARGRIGPLRFPIEIEALAGERARSPAFLGVLFGLAIPACAAPILFGLIGLSVTSGSIFLGFATMALFGLALSLPLAIMAVSPPMHALIDWLRARSTQARWIVSGIFIFLGLWSIWFGLFVDPANWADL